MLVGMAVWAAYTWPTRVPALVPSASVAAPFPQTSALTQRIVVAHLESIPLLLPVPLSAMTALAYEPVDSTIAVPFAPAGGRGNPSGLSGALAEVLSGGGMHYYTMAGDSSADSPPTGGLQVGAIPGTTVYAPADGQVTAVTQYELLGRYPDTEVDVRLAADSSIVLAIIHVAHPQVTIGEAVMAGETVLGSVRGFPPQLEQPLRQFTTDDGDHVELVAERVPLRPSGS